MDNLSVTSDVGNVFTRVEPTEVNKENSATAATEQVIATRQQVQKVAEQEAAKQAAEKPELEDVVQEINNVMATVQRDLNFSVDEKSGRRVISVYEKGTDKLIRQLPSKEALQLLDNLEQLKGILFKTDV